ncbi:ABC transporter permease [Acetobacterium woodii]|uniref:ABC transport system permease protein n=1 Tax=Acetobacterium woodii (strain ATCC 29683 / DSM 1030 / JCM 2381 / KCTC 1655 / WB1) TaxID=931626 RepID=H6LEY0_ACEWD|nr:ABC transporter permease [Acetobacterium woodii]AFA46886.1 ABC transport system permease protein [Acetobacterium woodii DSM 1030]
MFLRVLKAEMMKMRHSPVWLAFLLIPIIPAFMGTFNYLNNLGILDNQWYSLWTQHTLFACYFFLPVLIGIYCSYLFRLEHMNHNWNAIMTAPVPITQLFLAKLVMGGLMVVLTQIWVGLLFVFSGLLIGISTPIPADLPIWLFFGALGGMAVCALQLCLSLVIRSFAVPVGIALMGGIAGLALLSQGYGLYFPYALITLGMRANDPTAPMLVTGIQFLLASVIFTVGFCLFAIAWLKQRDVITG